MTWQLYVGGRLEVMQVLNIYNFGKTDKYRHGSDKPKIIIRMNFVSKTKRRHGSESQLSTVNIMHPRCLGHMYPGSDGLNKCDLKCLSIILSGRLPNGTLWFDF